MMDNFEITMQENVRGSMLTLALVMVIKCYITLRGVCIINVSFEVQGEQKKGKKIWDLYPTPSSQPSERLVQDLIFLKVHCLVI